MSQSIVKADTAQPGASSVEIALVTGDISKLAPEQRVKYYHGVCASLGLNPMTRPFQYVKLPGGERLYATKDCTEQLRKLHRVSLTITARERHDDVYVVTARAHTPDGRDDESIGAVPIVGLKGESLANALMKAETKAKRRVTLSICGLGMLDDSEVDSVPNSVRMAPIDVAAVPPAPKSAPVPEWAGDAYEGPDATHADCDALFFEVGEVITRLPEAWRGKAASQLEAAAGHSGKLADLKTRLEAAATKAQAQSVSP